MRAVVRKHPPQQSLQLKDQERLIVAIRQAGFESPQEQEKMLNILLQDPASMGYDCCFPQPSSFSHYLTHCDFVFLE
jgi:hypothetical protein